MCNMDIDKHLQQRAERRAHSTPEPDIAPPPEGDPAPPPPPDDAPQTGPVPVKEPEPRQAPLKA